MHIKTMKETKGQLRNETWFLYFIEKQIEVIRLSNDKKLKLRAKKNMLKTIKAIEILTGQKL